MDCISALHYDAPRNQPVAGCMSPSGNVCEPYHIAIFISTTMLSRPSLTISRLPDINAFAVEKGEIVR